MGVFTHFSVPLVIFQKEPPTLAAETNHKLHLNLKPQLFMNEEITRDYNLSDEDVLVIGQTMVDNLVAEQAAFTASFSHCTEEETQAFQAAVTTAGALPLDNEVMDNVQVLTADLAAQVKLGGQVLSSLGRYAIEAYPTDERRQRVFGQDDWDEARNDTEKMRDALEHAYNMVTDEDYKETLDAAGFKEDKRELLIETAKSITEKQRLQKKAQSNRPVDTQDRIASYNIVWAWMRKTNNRAQEVWKDDFARRKRYNLYPSSATGTQTVGVTVYKAGTTEGLADAQVSISNTALATEITNSEGKANFKASSFPDLLDIKILAADGGEATYEGLGFVDGGVNAFVLEVGSGVVEN